MTSVTLGKKGTKILMFQTLVLRRS